MENNALIYVSLIGSPGFDSTIHNVHFINNRFVLVHFPVLQTKSSVDLNYKKSCILLLGGGGYFVLGPAHLIAK